LSLSSPLSTSSFKYRYQDVDWRALYREHFLHAIHEDSQLRIVHRFVMGDRPLAVHAFRDGWLYVRDMVVHHLHGDGTVTRLLQASDVWDADRASGASGASFSLRDVCGDRYLVFFVTPQLIVYDAELRRVHRRMECRVHLNERWILRAEDQYTVDMHGDVIAMDHVGRRLTFTHNGAPMGYVDLPDGIRLTFEFMRPRFLMATGRWIVVAVGRNLLFVRYPKTWPQAVRNGTESTHRHLRYVHSPYADCVGVVRDLALVTQYLGCCGNLHQIDLRTGDDIAPPCPFTSRMYSVTPPGMMAMTYLTTLSRDTTDGVVVYNLHTRRYTKFASVWSGPLEPLGPSAPSVPSTHKHPGPSQQSSKSRKVSIDIDMVGGFSGDGTRLLVHTRRRPTLADVMDKSYASPWLILAPCSPALTRNG
jgi:hypothetical protein